MESVEPQLIWIEYEPGQALGSANHYFETFLSSTGDKSLSTGSNKCYIILESLNIAMRELNHKIGLLFVAEDRIAKPAYVNPCQAMIVPGYVRPWFGLVIVVALAPTEAPSYEADREQVGAITAAEKKDTFTENDNDEAAKTGDRPMHFVDFECREVRPVIDHIHAQPSNAGIPYPQSRAFTTVPALLLDNLEDGFIRAMNVKDDFTQTRTPPHHIEKETSAITLAVIIGLSWYIRDGNSLPTTTNRVWNVPHARHMCHISQATIFQDQLHRRHKFHGGAVR
ncbi:hypothetical protein BR93DRAFT_934158 [Coniochaeta sp. PMI_546]|nr:hypothetical protein BR93DRAFT_934158 [Coniochaeta sp. PMI_546]